MDVIALRTPVLLYTDGFEDDVSDDPQISLLLRRFGDIQGIEPRPHAIEVVLASLVSNSLANNPTCLCVY